MKPGRTQEATLSLATAEDTSADVVVAAILSQPYGIVTLKVGEKRH